MSLVRSTGASSLAFLTALWLVAIALGCGPAPARRPTEASARTAEAKGAVRAEPSEEIPSSDARSIVERVDAELIQRDLAFIARPRHATRAPEHLARVADYVAKELSAAGLGVTRQRVTYDRASADNIIAERPGTSPELAVLLAAHYDADLDSPGADAASGVAALLAVARAVARVKSRASLRFAAFAFEEQGLVGSDAYVSSLSLEERERLLLSIVLDGVGYRTHGEGSQSFSRGVQKAAAVAKRPLREQGDFLRWLGRDDLSESARAALRSANGFAPELEVWDLVMPPLTFMFYPSARLGIQSAFWDAGLVAVAADDTGSERNRNHGAAGDTLESLDPAFVTNVARWLTAALVLASDRVEAPRPARADRVRACGGQDVRLEELARKPECRAVRALSQDLVENAIHVEADVEGPVTSGRQGALWIAFVNRSTEAVDLYFSDHCLGRAPAELFDLEIIDAQGRNAMLVRDSGPIGLLRTGGDECKEPYLFVSLGAGGRVRVRATFHASVQSQISGPALKPGPLRPGHYTLRIVTPVNVEPLLETKIDVKVEPR